MPEGGDVLETLASLVDNSLLVSRSGASVRPEGGEPRFAMLETIKEYAAERLRSSGEAEEMHRAHALYYLELAEAAQPEASPHMFEEWLTDPGAGSRQLQGGASLGDRASGGGHRGAAGLVAVAVLVRALPRERGPQVVGGGAGAG